MYGEKIQETGCDKPTSIHQPELSVIIERLQSIVIYYGSILCETKEKLQAIKRFEQRSTLKEVEKEKEPETATEEINYLLSILDDLNNKAAENLRHLRKIV
jgi:hypothetical protein